MVGNEQRFRILTAVNTLCSTLHKYDGMKITEGLKLGR